MQNELLNRLLAGIAVGAIGATLLWNIIDVSGIAATVAGKVNEYCEKPADDRAVIRQKINDRIAPHTVVLTCSGDA